MSSFAESVSWSCFPARGWFSWNFGACVVQIIRTLCMSQSSAGVLFKQNYGSIGVWIGCTFLVLVLWRDREAPHFLLRWECEFGRLLLVLCLACSLVEASPSCNFIFLCDHYLLPYLVSDYMFHLPICNSGPQIWQSLFDIVVSWSLYVFTFFHLTCSWMSELVHSKNNLVSVVLLIEAHLTYTCFICAVNANALKVSSELLRLFVTGLPPRAVCLSTWPCNISIDLSCISCYRSYSACCNHCRSRGFS